MHRRDLHVTDWKEKNKVRSASLAPELSDLGPELTGSVLIPSQPSSLWVALDPDDVQVLSLLQSEVGLAAPVVQASLDAVDGLQGSDQLPHRPDPERVCDTQTVLGWFPMLVTHFELLPGFALLLLSLQPLFVPVQVLIRCFALAGKDA